MLFIKKELNEPLLCLFSDVIFDIKILEKLKKNEKDIVLAIDKNKIARYYENNNQKKI